MRLKRLAVASIVAGVAALAVAVPAFAFDCNVAKKPTGAGSAATIDATSDEGDVISFNKPNPGDANHIHGGFITLDFGGGVQADTFVHAHQGVLPPVQPGGPRTSSTAKASTRSRSASPPTGARKPARGC